MGYFEVMLVYSKPLRLLNFGVENVIFSPGKYMKLDVVITTRHTLVGWESDRAGSASRAMSDFGIGDFETYILIWVLSRQLHSAPRTN